MPAKPTTALRTTSGCDSSRIPSRSPPTCFSGASMSSSGVEPDVTAQSARSGWASTISIAWRPIDPVAPRRATRFFIPPVLPGRGSSRSTVPDSEDQVVRGRAGEEEGIDPVEHAAVAAEQPPRVLHLHVALQHRLEQVADDGREHHDEPEHDRLPNLQVRVARVVER